MELKLMCMVCLEQHIRKVLRLEEVQDAVVMAAGHTFCLSHYTIALFESERHNTALLEEAKLHHRNCEALGWGETE